jgi:chondroitin sulfate proteoglycan 4
VQSFSQEAVDEGKVLYLHSRPEARSDTFSLDVSSGLGTPLQGIRVELEVLPTFIPLEIQNFSVPESGTRNLAPPLLRVTGPYFPTLPGLELQVLEPPQHGALQREGQRPDATLSTFSWKEVCMTVWEPLGLQLSPGSSGGAPGTPSLGMCAKETLCYIPYLISSSGR